ncbi:ATP-binding protein [Pseudoflavonifractor capillosus]|uniref:ATP-binding protein n=1 Tax=Pseudoflavonifractor capillosus TaxID=106588 RepID=UPI00195C3322|nr:ATP-binding protein [Pseudoflavonifractor capillosus]MBM6897761.1 ATP-binding protein [Pseudoflavonifractor capillosus]
MNVDLTGLMQAKRNPGDYVGKDGLLYCSKCNTPKQIRLNFNPATGAKEETLVRSACKCEQEAAEVEQQRANQEKFKKSMERRWEDGISAPNGLRYSFAEDDRADPRVSDACRRYVENWKEMQMENIGILFHGTVGTGKSFLASCIGNALLDKQISVAATNFPRLLNLLQGASERQKLLDRLSTYKLLILDDLGVERDSTYAAEQIFNVIDARASSGLPVIVTTNMTLEELEHPNSMQYARIYDRVLDMCPVRFKLLGESRRRGNAKVKKQLAQRILLD